MLQLSDDPDLIHTCLLGIYRACLVIVWVYSFSRWKNLLVAVWLSNKVDASSTSNNDRVIIDNDEEDFFIGSSSLKVDEKNFPLRSVTVQILSYNEAEVVPKTIAKACELNWPKDRLFIQVLDDSTDLSAVRIVKNVVSMYRRRGIQIEYKTRPDRHGYKAGNLNYHFNSIQTEFVLHLDGDHQVEPDVLHRTVPIFQNKPKLALVQAPWGYYNTHSNVLTECDALGLDMHHTVEQVKSAYPLFQMHFDRIRM